MGPEDFSRPGLGERREEGPAWAPPLSGPSLVLVRGQEDGKKNKVQSVENRREPQVLYLEGIPPPEFPGKRRLSSRKCAEKGCRGNACVTLGMRT